MVQALGPKHRRRQLLLPARVRRDRACARPQRGGRSLIQRHHPLPWIPNENEWQDILEVCKEESLRNWVMLAMS